jgi:hypothetical protein
MLSEHINCGIGGTMKLPKISLLVIAVLYCNIVVADEVRPVEFRLSHRILCGNENVDKDENVKLNVTVHDDGSTYGTGKFHEVTICGERFWVGVTVQSTDTAKYTFQLTELMEINDIQFPVIETSCVSNDLKQTPTCWLRRREFLAAELKILQSTVTLQSKKN